MVFKGTVTDIYPSLLCGHTTHMLDSLNRCNFGRNTNR